VDVKAARLAVEISGESRSARDDLSLAARVDRLGELRRRIVRLGRSSAVIELQNTIWRLSELERRIKKAARRAKVKDKTVQVRFTVVNPKESAVLALLPQYQRKMATLSELASKSANAEDEALLMLYSGETLQLAAEQVHVIQEIETGLQTLLRQLLDLRFAHPNRVTIAIYSENKDALFELARAYYKTAVGMQMQVRVSYYTTNVPAKKDDEPKVIEMLGRKVVRAETNKPAEFFSRKPDACNAVVFRLDGKSAFAMWALEYGLHTFVEGKTSNPVFVHTSDVEAKEYRPPPFLEKRGTLQPANVGALIILMSVTPWTQFQAGHSPFIAMFSLAGLGMAATVVNLVVLTSAMSSANSGIYSTSRMVYGLANDGDAPKLLLRERTTRRGNSSHGWRRHRSLMSAIVLCR